MSNNYGPRIVTDGLVLCLDAADKNSYPGSGTAWKDLSGNSNDVTLYNGPTFSSTNAGVLVFDATNEYARVLTPNITLGTGSRTLMGWFSATASTYGCIFGYGNSPISSPTYGSFELWNYNPGLRIHYSGGNKGVTPDFNLSNYLNKWIFVVMTYNGTTAVINITCDGITYTGSVNVSLNTRTNNFSINKSAYATEGGGMSGNWACFLTYSKVLSALEITQNYNATKGRFGL